MRTGCGMRDGNFSENFIRLLIVYSSIFHHRAAVPMIGVTAETDICKYRQLGKLFAQFSYGTLYKTVFAVSIAGAWVFHGRFNVSKDQNTADALTNGYADDVRLNWGDEFPYRLEFTRYADDDETPAIEGMFLQAPRVPGGDDE